MIAKSPQRQTFQHQKYLESQAQKGLTPDNDEQTFNIDDFFKNIRNHRYELEADSKFQVNNLEYDLRSTDWIIEKTKESRVYAQNLYAAMCNRDFMKNHVWPILKEEVWNCSWRHAGGIIADMRGEGDYIDWYCSGIKHDTTNIEQEEWNKLTLEQQLHHKELQGFVAESILTDEIREDLFKLGWIVTEEIK
jgi:hypothetical protein